MAQIIDGELHCVWCKEDVFAQAEGEEGRTCTDAQAAEVLERCARNFDANVGVNWDVLEYHLSEVLKKGEIMNVSELSSAKLDWAVAKSEGVISNDIDDFCLSVKGEYNYSSNWSLGGVIIEREKIAIDPDGGNGRWAASMAGANCFWLGDTPLIAAMRCYMSSVVGDAVDIPSELFNEVKS